MCDSLFLEIQCALGSKFSSFKKLHTETPVHTLTYKKEKTNKLKETTQNVFEFGITTIICKGQLAFPVTLQFKPPISGVKSRLENICS